MRTLSALLVAVALGGCAAHHHEHADLDVFAPDDGEAIWVLHESAEGIGTGGELQIYVDSHTHPRAKAGFARFTLGVGGALPIHRHNKTEEFAYVISGDGLAVAVEDNGAETALPLHTGYVWYNPPGNWHAMRNAGDEPLVIVFATVPAEAHGLLQFFREVGVAPGNDPKPLTMDELKRLGAEYDLILFEPEE